MKSWYNRAVSSLLWSDCLVCHWHPKDVQWVYQLNWGVFCAMIRSDIVTILACLDLFHAWILVAYLLDHDGISSSVKDYYNSDERSSRWADRWLEYWYKRIEGVEIIVMIITSYSSVWSMCCCWWHFCYSSLLAIVRKKVGEPRKEIGNLYGF